MSFDAGYTQTMLLASSWISDAAKYGTNRDTRLAAAHPGDVVFSVPPSGFSGGGYRNEPSVITVFPNEAPSQANASTYYKQLYDASRVLGVVVTGTPLGADPLGAPEMSAKLDGKSTIKVRNPDANLMINVGDPVFARPPNPISEKPMRGERNVAVITNDPTGDPNFQKLGRALSSAGPGQMLDLVLARV